MNARVILPILGWSALISTASAQTYDTSSYSGITFNVSFTDNALNDLSTTEQSYFTKALAFWDEVIIGYRDGSTRTWTLTVDTFSQASSGGGVLLGSAGPSSLAYSGVVADANTSNGKFIISTAGSATFNTHDDAGELNYLTICHEIGHALGIGTLWEDNQVYNDGDDTTGNRTLTGGIPGQYVGSAALAAYQAEFDPSATYVPVELDGDSGTSSGHWNEVTDNYMYENTASYDSDPGDSSAAPIVLYGTYAGESFDDELMSGVLSGSSFLSDTTIASLYDIGYLVIPEPASSLMIGSSLIMLASRRRR
ncbi:MAG: PEP-CTERM sorting domain-containing protein [Verrucomicrobiota bacterium JB025]|nr:PEP-CTERM sorting domain-containing protein [Verrucomicrobiota bacterium JB025]